MLPLKWTEENLLDDVEGDMLSNKIILFCQNKKWWFDDVEPTYKDALLKMGFDISSDFSQFYLHVEDGPTFTSKNGEIYQICWFLNNSDYDGRLRVAREILKIPEPYIPLDSFAGERGYFYNMETGQVFDVGLGNSLKEFVAGNAKAQWGGFNEFIEWFFDI
ncbi:MULTISPECIES: hypothetical protein [unclassified Burkholderia]|uniref:hypothetical protein n=1 Tax=unclassified Burkholderia TaxID=2613784 RepID=UPI001E488C74|nr:MULTISPECIES: hypothetical protein [unclassified Burkholderia]UEP30982.1 hypothetical protein LMA01_17285 [Burkholderia sp. B21-007]UEP43741.1 hypothetical protein LMA02_27215 [Burkholderia sp. B21-005]